MSLKERFGAMLVLAAVAAVAVSGALRARSTDDDSAVRFCCVANPRFAGICKVELAPEETCADVLTYLNNAASVGKTYCAATPVRMGWKQVECQEEED